MSVLTIVAATGVTVAVGKWVSDEKLTLRVFAGMGIITITLMGIEEAQPKLATQLAVLILVSALFIYGEKISAAIGKLK